MGTSDYRLYSFSLYWWLKAAEGKREGGRGRGARGKGRGRAVDINF